MSNFFDNLKSLFDPKKLGFIALAIVLLFLVMDLNTRLNELSRLTAQRDDAATIVANLEGTLQVLFETAHVPAQVASGMLAPRRKQ